MFKGVTKRSLYDRAELRSLVQKMLRHPGLLPEGLPQFHYFIDEYLPTLKNDAVNLLLFVTEDCARCHPQVLKCIIKLMKNKKDVTDEDYHRFLLALAQQPVDRSAAYLSVACLEVLGPLETTMKRQLSSPGDDGTAVESATSMSGYWQNLVTLGAAEFASCMEHIFQETNAVPTAYPMSPGTVLRLAAAFTHLDGWQSRYPESLICKEKAQEAIVQVFGNRVQSNAIRVRPLVLGLFLVTRWMERVDPDAIPTDVRDLVWLHLEAVMLFCGSKRARVHLSAFVTLLILSGRMPVAELPPQMAVPDLAGVPIEGRFYPMPKVAQDKHTFRGKHITDTTRYLEEHCRREGLPMPSNPEYSHGPSPHATPQTFEDFVRHVTFCEQENGDGVAPLFKEEAIRLYLAQPPKRRRRRFILGERLPIEAIQIEGGAQKRKRTPRKADDSTSKKRCIDWVKQQAPVSLQDPVRWEALSKDRPMAQRPAGGKPPVVIDSLARRVIKGPFRGHSAPMQDACLTKLDRNVFGLVHCVPEVAPFISSDGNIGLVSPMIGREPQSTCQVSDNADRGMDKLHEYKEDSIGCLANPIDILKIVTVKNLLQSSDNNTSNMVVVRDSKRVYGLDFGGAMKKAKLASQAEESVRLGSFKWAFSKPPNKQLLSQIDDLANRHAVEMSSWLRSFLVDDVRARYQTVVGEFPSNDAPGDYTERLNLFVAYFDGIAKCQ